MVLMLGEREVAAVPLLGDATSALDAKPETLVVDAWNRPRAGCTTLVIAHRLSTRREAHSIVMTDEGRVTKHGRHNELVAKDRLYAHPHQLQFKDKGGQGG